MSSLGTSFPKKVALWSLIATCFLAAGYLTLVFSLSILIGLRAAPQPGFWLPILTGAMCLIPILWALISITKLLLAQMAEEDIVSL